MALNTTPATWVAGTTVTAAQMNTEIRDAITGIQASAGTWSPTLTGSTLGNGTISARFTRVGKWVDFSITFTLGSTSTVATGTTFTLPVTALSATGHYMGSMFDTSAGATWPMGAIQTSTTVIAIRQFAATAGAQYASVTATVPFTWATGDVMFLTGRYEAA